MPSTTFRTEAPPPPPPSIPAVNWAPSRPPHEPPIVSTVGPAGAFMVELLVFNGAPFKDHWAYWVRSQTSPDVGVWIHAIGDVMNGFKFEVKRSHDFRGTADVPTKRIPLQWVDAKWFDEVAMLNNGRYKLDSTPVCGFEASAYKIKAPGKTLNAVNEKVPSDGKRITQRNCQTWIVESADQLVKDCIFSKDVATYLRASKQ
ncbi:hypothetical protein UCRPC4_g01153 [Phaeomoniella chlamydospora]|uniref:Uncharacterized protein n=1 Tax=Phaeomoniella chlamydospora TaxID=158046 RepID=A0A0G2EX97_PHACM|nr:hypothetical protein UCRPC4_g01153 [Phaeomoniella chlamydospora]